MKYVILIGMGNSSIVLMILLLISIKFPASQSVMLPGHVVVIIFRALIASCITCKFIIDSSAFPVLANNPVGG